jgi:hypothetical protein
MAARQARGENRAAGADLAIFFIVSSEIVKGDGMMRK